MNARDHRSDLSNSLKPFLHLKWNVEARQQTSSKHYRNYRNKHRRDVTVNVPEMQNWTLDVNLCCLLCSWLRHNAKYTATWHHRRTDSWNEMFVFCSRLKKKKNTGKTKRSQRGIWPQMSKVSNTCMQRGSRFTSHFLAHSLSISSGWTGWYWGYHHRRGQRCLYMQPHKH